MPGKAETCSGLRVAQQPVATICLAPARPALRIFWRESETADALFYQSPGELSADSYLVNANGSINLLVLNKAIGDRPYYNPEQKPYEGAGLYYLRGLATNILPVREAGSQTLVWFALHFDVDEQRTWSYQAGQRRVRLAPEFSYDTPVSQVGGAIFYDEVQMFAGRMDRFDFQLKGKKFMYLPYNNYRFTMIQGDPAQLLVPA